MQDAMAQRRYVSDIHTAHAIGKQKPKNKNMNKTLGQDCVTHVTTTKTCRAKQRGDVKS